MKQLSAVTLYILSFLLIANGLPALLRNPEAPYRYIYSGLGLMQSSEQIPYLMTFRNQTGRLFLAGRVQNHPIVYKWLHVIPAVAWSLLMPLQHVASIRRSFPTFHRWSGYFLFTTSFVLACTGLTFPFIGSSHSEKGFFRLYNIPGYPWAIYPTFDQDLFIIAVAQLFSMIKALQAARARNIRKHEFWAKMHTIASYVIHLDRVGFMIMFSIGGVCKALEKKDFVTALCNKPATIKQVYHHELIGFQLCALFGGVIGVVWAFKIYSEHSMGGIRVKKG